jgi:hypothetical protein
VKLARTIRAGLRACELTLPRKFLKDNDGVRVRACLHGFRRVGVRARAVNECKGMIG